MSEVPPAKAIVPTTFLGSFARYWTLGVLAVVAFLATVDRQAFAVLLVPVQQELQVSDSAMGFLMGSAFAVAQAIFTIPLAWLSDRTNRRNLLAIAVAVWSVATALGGLAGSFVTLLLARLVVGAAEAAQTPATVSMVSDLFGRNQRGSAFMVCSAGTALGVAFGAYAGGMLSDRYGWHAALYVVGLPGLLVAAILYLTVREPVRALPIDANKGGANGETILGQLRKCLAIPTLPPFIIGFLALQGAVMGWFVWFPVFLMRTHGLTASQMGAIFGTVILFGVISTVWAGPVSDLLARRGARWRLHFIVGVTLTSRPLLSLSSLVPTMTAAQICAMGFTLLLGGMHPVATATYASLSPPTMRAFVAGLVYVFVTIFGAAAAPLVFGILNDALSPVYGDQALRYTLLLAPALLGVAACFFWIAGRTVEDDTAAAESLVAPS
jgi:predicted MFS family arabinose efflux permease